MSETNSVPKFNHLSPEEVACIAETARSLPWTWTMETAPIPDDPRDHRPTFVEHVAGARAPRWLPDFTLWRGPTGVEVHVTERGIIGRDDENDYACLGTFATIEEAVKIIPRYLDDSLRALGLQRMAA